MSPTDPSSFTDGPVQAPTLLAGRYRLERRIGQGGMAEVWVALDEQLDRRVAVKWLKPNLATDPVVAERFRREAIAVAQLHHPNIVAVYDVVAHDGRQAVVMQLVEGRSLRQLLDSQKRLGPELTIHIGASVSAALDAAHRAGFVHRDVKPGNILLTDDGRVLLTDFGIAKGLDGGDRDLTSDNVMMGTAKYLSPEQVRGTRLDGRADLYSLALVLYECLAGRVPFLGQSDADTALARLQRDPTDLAHLRPTLPIALVNLIHRTLARNPVHRPATGADLRSELMAVDTSPPHIDGTPAEPPPVRTRPVRPDESGRLGRAPVTPTVPVSPSGTSTIPGQPVAVPEQPPELFNADDHTGVVESRRFGGPPVAVASAVVLLAVLLTAILVWNRNDTGSDQVSPLPEMTVATATVPDANTPLVLPDSEADFSEAEQPESPLGGVSASAWDPFGDNGSENNAQAALALADGSRDTAWSTECYSDQYMGAKNGVGLIVALPGLSAGTIEFESLNAPFQVDVLTTDAATPPLSFDVWRQTGPTAFDVEPGLVTVPVTTPSTHVLVWLRELGPDDACSSTNPYRGRIGEIRWSAAS
jgi:serine/threonine protein kinase